MNRFKLRGIYIKLILMALSQLVGTESPNFHSSKTISTKNSVLYMTGGIGKEVAGAIRANAKKYTLNLLFFEGSSGCWATNINENIYDEASNFFLELFVQKQCFTLIYPLVLTAF